jgi:hypothetical protein
VLSTRDTYCKFVDRRGIEPRPTRCKRIVLPLSLPARCSTLFKAPSKAPCDTSHIYWYPDPIVVSVISPFKVLLIMMDPTVGTLVRIQTRITTFEALRVIHYTTRAKFGTARGTRTPKTLVLSQIRMPIPSSRHFVWWRWTGSNRHGTSRPLIYSQVPFHLGVISETGASSR